MLCQKTFDCGKCRFSTFSLNLIQHLLRIIISPPRRLYGRMTTTFTGNFFGTASLDGSKVLYETILKVFPTTKTFHGRVGTQTDISLTNKIK